MYPSKGISKNHFQALVPISTNSADINKLNLFQVTWTTCPRLLSSWLAASRRFLRKPSAWPQSRTKQQHARPFSETVTRACQVQMEFMEPYLPKSSWFRMNVWSKLFPESLCRYVIIEMKGSYRSILHHCLKINFGVKCLMDSCALHFEFNIVVFIAYFCYFGFKTLWKLFYSALKRRITKLLFVA